MAKTKKKAPPGLDYRAVKVGGRECKLRFSVASIRRAKQAGISLSQIIEEFQGVDESTPIDDALLATAKLIWFGRLAFEPDLTLEEVEEQLDFGELRESGEVAQELFQEFLPETNGQPADEDAQEAVEAVVEEGEGQAGP